MGYDSDRLAEAIAYALHQRSLGRSSNIALTDERARRLFGMNEPEQDLREMAADHGLDFDEILVLKKRIHG